jgi:hypothetical protein
MNKPKLLLSAIFFLLATFAFAAPPPKPEIKIQHWVSLSSDSRDSVREIILSEVDKRDGFSTLPEQKANIKAVEDEKEKEDTEYKRDIITANREFSRAKKKRDDATTQFQVSSTELDESGKGIKTIYATIENIENQIERYEQDINTQQASLKSWLQTEKHGEILVAVIYTRGFKDSAHDLESSADQASAPLIAQHMGTYITSFTKVIDNVIDIDFIRATESGIAKWNNEAPLRMELEQGENGTTYLRLKRYELYPFQDNKAGRVKAAGPSTKYKVAIITSRNNLDAFLTQNQLLAKDYDLNRFDSLIKDTAQSNAAAEESLNEQIKTFQDRIIILRSKIDSAKGEKESQKMLLKHKEDAFAKMKLDVATIKDSKEGAENQFQEAQANLLEKKRTHESIIIKTALATTKGSQTPAEASAEAILDKLAEVKNDAKTQHSTSTTEVANFKVSAESSVQAITEARIISVRLISFINEGDNVRVNMAFRVRTVLEEQKEAEVPKPPPEESKPFFSRFKSDDTAPDTKPAPETKPAPADEPPQQTIKAVIPFKRTYRPLATKDALGCLFDLRSVSRTKDGIHIVLEVINTDNDSRSIAFYDERFPRSWPRSKIYDESNKYYDITQASVLQGNQKRLMYEIDSRGHGIELKTQTSVSMELFFKNTPANTRTVKINLHPFIYFKQGWKQTWQEFDLTIPNIRLYNEAPGLKNKK